MSQDTAPAIRREQTEEDRGVEVVRRLKDDVSKIRGLGYSGQVVEMVDYECPRCSHDRMVRSTRVYPEDPSDVSYWCQNLTCPHYIGEKFGYIRGMRASEPTVVDE